MRSAAHSDLARQTLAVIMAGGNGTRLGDLTRWHSKPALPFGGQYRNIDFPLSNCINSGIRRVTLLTQYKAHSLIQHVQQGWSFLRPDLGEFVELWPAQQRRGESWYAGTADALHQNIDLIAHHRPEYVLVLAGDHVYKMDYVAMLAAHVESGADVTVGCVQVPVAEARSFGVMAVDEDGWVSRFEEKPARPKPLPADPSSALASMGIYVFGRRFLMERLAADARNPRSTHDFGRDVLPSLIGRRSVLAHPFGAGDRRPAYWRDVGTLASYWRANMELLDDDPPLDLHDRRWPIRTHQQQCPPPRFVGEGTAIRSIISGGCAIAGRVAGSVLSTNCRVRRGSVVESSVVLSDVEIGRNCHISRAIIDHGCVVPDGTVIRGDAVEGEPSREASSEGVALVTADMLDRMLAEHERRVA